MLNKSGDPRTGHQTQKPLALMEKLVRLFSNNGELVLDPFSRFWNRQASQRAAGLAAVGWEIDPTYAADDVARRRLGHAREQLVPGF